MPIQVCDLACLCVQPSFDDMQDLITNLLRKQQERGQTLNHAMKSHRDYRNPNFLQKMVEFCDIQQYGSCYPEHLWDPTALHPEDHATALLQEHADWQDRRALVSPSSLSMICSADILHCTRVSKMRASLGILAHTIMTSLLSENIPFCTPSPAAAISMQHPKSPLNRCC